jgi:hypothetical protein
MCPMTILAVLIGYRPLRGLKSSKNSASDILPGKPALTPFIEELIPILLVIFPGIGAGVILSYGFPQLSISKEIGLFFSLFMAIGWVWYQNAFNKQQIWKVLSDPQILSMMYIVVSILIFKGILEDCRAADAMSNELLLLKVPLVLIAVILPFLVGLITGITIAFVGVTFPILIPLIVSAGETGIMLPYVMLAMVCGFAGVLLSPLHLCLILSNEYFKTTMGAVYRHLWLLCLLLISSGIVYFLISGWVLKLI